MYTLPFIVVLVSLILVKDQEGKPSRKTLCIVSGIISIMLCSIYTGKLSLYQCIEYLFNSIINVMCENYGLFITLLLFGVLINLITASGSIEVLTIKMNGLIKNKLYFFVFLIVLALAFSIDDYLACIVLTTILMVCREKLGLSKEELGFFINTVVVFFCSMVPISTWAPIIMETLSSDSILNNAYFPLRFCFNYYPYLSILVIILILASKKRKKDYLQYKTQKKASNTNMYILVFALAILYATYMITHNISYTHISNNALLISCFFTLIFCHIAFRRNGNIKHNNIKTLYIHGFKNMWNLVKFLFFLWIYTDCLNGMLHMNETILIQISKMNIPIVLLPIAVFLFSGFISYCTGSIFATIRLLVPISISVGTSLGLNQTFLWLIASAALNGSLLASVSPLSDTLKICCDELKIDSKSMYMFHLPYSLLTIAATAISYLLVGMCIEVYPTTALILPIPTVIPIMALYVLSVPYLNALLHALDNKAKYILSKINIVTVQKSRIRHNMFAKCPKNIQYTSSKPKRNHSIYKLKLC